MWRTESRIEIAYSSSWRAIAKHSCKNNSVQALHWRHCHTGVAKHLVPQPACIIAYLLFCHSIISTHWFNFISMVEKLSFNYLDMNDKKTVQNIESLIWLYLTFNKDIDWLLNRHIFRASIEGKYATISTTEFHFTIKINLIMHGNSLCFIVQNTKRQCSTITVWTTIEEDGFTATRIVRIWNVGVQKLSFWHLYCKHIENFWDCPKLLTPLQREAHWHCQVEKVKWVLYGWPLFNLTLSSWKSQMGLYGLRRVKRKGSGEVFPEQESLAVYRI